MTVKVTARGNLFDKGVTDRAIEVATEKIVAEVAEYAHKQVTANMRAFQNPTGWYKSNTQRKKHRDGIRVTDNDLVYGPWLEFGGGKFDGYQLWGNAHDETERQVERISKRAIKNMLTVINF